MKLVLTKELARKIERSEVEDLESRRTAIQGIKGNPMGIAIQKFGHATQHSLQKTSQDLHLIQ